MNNTVTQTSGRLPNIPVWLIIFLLAASVRGLYLYESSRNPTFYTPIVDSQSYDLLARQLAEGKPITSEFFWQQSFYPFFLSAVYFFCNSSILCAKLIQALLGCVTCVLTYHLGKKLYGQTAGIIAGCILAIYGPVIFFETELLTEGLALFWTALLLLILLKITTGKNLFLYFAFGVCAALSIATRPNFLPFLLGVFVWLLCRKNPDVQKGRLTLAVGIMAGFLTAALPIAVLNHRVTGSFSILPHTGGVNFYIGNNPDFDAASIRPGLKWQEIIDLPAKSGLHSWRQQQFYFYKKTFNYIHNQPLSFLKGLLHKTTEFICSREVPGNIDIYLFSKWSKLLDLLVWKIDGFGFPFGILLPLSILGLFYCRRQTPLAVTLFCILYPASIILTHIEARYRLPLIVPMCILAGAALTKIIQVITAKQWRNTTTIAFFCLGVACLCSISGPFYSEKHINYEAELYYSLGGSLSKRGQTDDAIIAYFKAIDLKSDYAEAHHNLGLLLAKQNKFEEAESHYKKALETAPENAPLYKDLGVAAFMLGKIPDAIEYYQKAVQLNPQNAASYEYLALALQSQGRFNDAVDYYYRALSIEPQNAEIHYNLAVALQLQGKLNEAIDNFTEVLKIQPDSAETHNNLAYALESQGKFPQAVKHYRLALQINPDYLPALNNIANILVTHPDPNMGNINDAFVFAERAVNLTKHSDAATLDTLASAYAAAGKFDKAAATAQQALQLALTAGNNDLASHIRSRLEFYKQPKP